MLDAPTTRLRWEMLDGSGWQFLLPPPAGRRLVCYDCLGGATVMLLAGLGAEVWVVHHDEEALRRLEAKAVAAHITGLRFGTVGGDGTLPFAGPVDGFILHDPSGTVVRRGAAAPPLDRLTAMMVRSLRPGGFAYVGIKHRFSYTRLRRGSRRGERPNERLLSVGSLTRLLRRSGLTIGAIHPLLLQESRLLEVVAECGYRSAKNRFLTTERLREILLGEWGARYFAPAYAVLAFRGAPEPSWMERILAEPWVQALCPSAAVRRYLVLNDGKVLLVLAPRERRPGLVLVLTPDEQGVGRRRREAAILRELARQLPPELVRVIPACFGEAVLQGARAFGLAELPGVTVDQDAPFLPEMTRAAARWLIDFHRATRAVVEISPPELAAVFGGLFDLARERYPPLSSELTALERRVGRAVTNTRLGLVWLHGDFKLENVVFDEAHRSVRGVIDWELSISRSLPLLDLLYLLAYNRSVRAKTDVLAGIHQIIAGPRTPEEKALVAEYGEAFPDAGTHEPVLVAMFLVHHIACRFRYDPDNERTRAALGAVLRAVHEPLDAT